MLNTLKCFQLLQSHICKVLKVQTAHFLRCCWSYIVYSLINYNNINTVLRLKSRMVYVNFSVVSVLLNLNLQPNYMTCKIIVKLKVFSKVTNVIFWVTKVRNLKIFCTQVFLVRRLDPIAALAEAKKLMFTLGMEILFTGVFYTLHAPR